MKKFLKAVSIVLMISALIACFAACEKEQDGDKEDLGVGFDISEYTIVRPDAASSDLITAAGALKNRIAKSANVTLAVSDDWYEEGEDVESKKEILIGSTNRTATESAQAKLDTTDNEKAFVIEVVGNKIVILGKNEDITIRAIKYFAVNFVSTSEREGTISIDPEYSKAGKADTSTQIFVDTLLELRYNDVNTVYNSGEYDNKITIYPKSIVLQHQSNDESNGILLATMNSGESFYRIMRSDDNGDTWSEVTQLRDTYNTDLNGGRMPHLFELPEDIGEFKKGTILLGGTSSPKGGSNADYEKTAITLYSSTDLGETWTAQPSIDYGAGKIDGNGVWEPFLIYDDETNRLYCFYSDDTGNNVEGDHDQKLVYKYTTDLKTWVGKDGKTGQTDEPYEAVACANSKYRAGMISIAKMGNGKYIATYEMYWASVYRSNCPVYYKVIDALDDWGDISDPGTLLLSPEEDAMASSPWVAWSPVGGECGTLVIAADRWARKSGTYDTSAPDLFLSFDYGKTFITIENPIGYTISSNNKCGYSPCVMFSADGKTLYYFTNPNKKMFVDNEYIAMTRIDLIW